jgi:hypothetical protein
MKLSGMTPPPMCGFHGGGRRASPTILGASAMKQW